MAKKHLPFSRRSLCFGGQILPPGLSVLGFCLREIRYEQLIKNTAEELNARSDVSYKLLSLSVVP